MTLDGATTITRSWSFYASTLTSGDGDVVQMIPEAFAEALDQGELVWGGFCMHPVRSPVSLEVDRPWPHRGCGSGSR
ncbi:MAG: hypothetical protein CL927_00800 [Deltaproteobacteria bacterium]|nr:hypothetical protein [Deltaproteobacteria bacterium]HCH64696.1 hypothetical protein [Deltaproteobacteria bacterium]